MVKIKLTVLLLFCFGFISGARGAAVLLLEEPYSYDGMLAGTGHAAVYLSNICASSPVELRACASDEAGVVLSRYHAIGGYDWIAVPLVSYLYAVERPQDVPLYANGKLVAFLRDRYRRAHLLSLAPDLPGGGTPGGEWYQLVGASYLRTIYAFQIETSPARDAALIDLLNRRPNRAHWNLITSNCADFARQIIDFYYPHVLHRSILGDLGVTTPKHLAKLLSRYSRRHPNLESSSFVIPQVPGALPRSKPIHGVLECALTAKKYMLPVVALHPYIVGPLVTGYFVHRPFDPARNALILHSRHLDPPLTPEERREFLSRLRDLSQGIVATDSERQGWDTLQAKGEPALDSSGAPVVQLTLGSQTTTVGVAPANVMESSSSPLQAAELVEARLRRELHPQASRQVSPGEIEDDFALLQKLLAPQSPDSIRFSTAQAGSR